MTLVDLSAFITMTLDYVSSNRNHDEPFGAHNDAS